MVIMEEFLKTLTGKKIDAFCGGPSSLRGKVVKVESGVLHLQDDAGDVCYVAVEKIIAVWEKRDKEHLAGFVSKS
jgi:DNA-binding NtrC family response regulator